MRTKMRRETEKDLRVDFKSRMRSKLNERQILADLFKSQKACEQLDSNKVSRPFLYTLLPVSFNKKYQRRP